MAAVATAAVHVARAEQRSASLEQVTADTAEQMLTAAEIANDTERLVNEQRGTEDETKTEIEAEEQQEMGKQEEKTDTAAAAAAVNMWKQQQQKQQQQQRQQVDKVNSSQTETTRSKKRNLPTTENNKIHAAQEDVSSWPYFVYVFLLDYNFSVTFTYRVFTFHSVGV